MLTIHGVDKYYSGRPILTAIDLELSAGESHGLIGLNGAGKTSLIKCILDLQTVDAGYITINGHSSQQPAARQELIYLPEKFSPPDYMTGYMYLRYIEAAYKNQGLLQNAFNERIAELSAALEFDQAALQQSTRTFSKGMLQKLGLMGCVLSDKSLFILDEPMSGLDPKARVLFRRVMQQLRAAGKTILLCSHILTDIAQLCDRFSILDNGRLLFTGTLQESYRQFAATELETAFLNCIQATTAVQ